MREKIGPSVNTPEQPAAPVRHPILRIASQGGWYFVGNALVKVSGFILLPVYTNSRYLRLEEYGIWGLLEISVQIAVAVLGVQITYGLLRFYADASQRERAVYTTWWFSVLGACASLLAGMVLVAGAVPAAWRPLSGLLAAYVALELLLAVPVTLLRAREQAWRYTTLLGVKLALLIALNLYFLVGRGMGLHGLILAGTLASGGGLAVAAFLAPERGLWPPRLHRETARLLVRFSTPFVLVGLSTLVLNAGDRYIVALFRPEEDVALYTLAAKLGGVVNMILVQPFQMALLPVFFRLAVHQRPAVLELLLRYLTVGLCALVVALSVVAAPVLRLIRADPAYQAAIPLVPWIGFGFVAFGLGIVSGAVLTLFKETRTISFWVLLSAAFNIGLNFVAVPLFGPLGAAVMTLLAYALLFAGLLRHAQRLLPLRYPWRRILTVVGMSMLVSLAGVLWRGPTVPTDLLGRLGLLVLWGGAVSRGFTLREAREIWVTFRDR